MVDGWLHWTFEFEFYSVSFLFIYGKKVLTHTMVDSSRNVAFELQKLEMELKFQRQKELDDHEEQRQKEMHDRELQVKLKEMEYQSQFHLKELELKHNQSSHSSSDFDVGKHIRLVPPFKEKEVDGFFLHFEKVAIRLKWPDNVWTLLLQSVLAGKAQEVYASMSVEQSSDYQFVKKAILQAYELVPEAYRQKFRSLRKKDDETYVEFAREKETLFDRWCVSRKVGNDFNQLRQLMLVEEFKRCTKGDIKSHLEERPFG